MNKKNNILLKIILLLLIIVTFVILSIKLFHNKKDDTEISNDLLGVWVSSYSYLYIDDKLIEENSSFDGEYIELTDNDIKFCYSNKTCDDYEYKVDKDKIILENNENKDIANDYSYELKDDKLIFTVIDGNMKVITNYVKAEG